MAVIRYRCTDCDRNIELIERPESLETIGRCIITNKCTGTLYRTDRLEDYVVGRFPDDVTGLTNWIQRNVVYDHTQAIADSIWTVTHNLGVNPSVQVIVDRETTVDGTVTSSRIEIQPETTTIVDENTLTLTFDRPESGLAQIIARSTRATELIEEADPGITYLPVTVDGILTLGIDIDSGQFPAVSTTTCTVRLYFLDQEELTETALETAVFNDYEVTANVNSTSAWSDASEIFVNGDVYTVVTLDLGDPINDFNAPSAGAVLFNAGTSISGFPYDQAANVVVLLSSSPHLNADKDRRRLFRPDLEVGPALTLDSFIFANGELVVDQSKTETAFPPIYLIDAPQAAKSPDPTVTITQAGSPGDIFTAIASDPQDGDITDNIQWFLTPTGSPLLGSPNLVMATGGTFDATAYLEAGNTYTVLARVTDSHGNSASDSVSYSVPVPIVIEPGFVMAFGSFDPADEGDAFGSQYTSDNDATTWTGKSLEYNFVNPRGVVYAESISTWVLMTREFGSYQLYSTNDGVTWTAAPAVDSFSTALNSRGTAVAWSPTLALFVCGGDNGQIQRSSDGITWVTSEPQTSGTFGTDDINTICWAEDDAVFVCGTDGGRTGTSSDGITWSPTTQSPSIGSDVDVVYAVGSRVFAGSDNGGVYSSDNLGASAWSFRAFISGGDPAAIAANSDGSVILVGGPGLTGGENVLRSTNGGTSFATVNVASQLGFTDIYSDALIYDPDYGFILGGRNVGDDNHIIATSDDGLTWTTRLDTKLLTYTNDFKCIGSKSQV